MKRIGTPKFVQTVGLLLALLATGAPALQAQSGFILSKNADFSTNDRVFDRSDVLHMKVTAPEIDVADLDKNEFRLKPDEGGRDVRGVFTNNRDGTYTASLSLDLTDPDEAAWEWRARLEDDAGQAFEARVDLQLGDDDGDGEDDDEDDENDDDDENEDDEVEFTGTIEALGAGSITVDTLTFVVTDATVVLDDDNNSILFADLAVGMLVEIRGELDVNGVLVATRIKIEDEDDDTPDVTGAIEMLEADRLVLAGHTFLVDGSTRVLDANDAPMAFADLVVGVFVEVHARNVAAVPSVASLVKVASATATAVESEGDAPTRFVLAQNYPNPFNPMTTIPFEIGEAFAGAAASLVVYNLLGQEVRTLVQGQLGPGRYRFVWDARNNEGAQVVSGLYLYRLRVGAQALTRTMILIQ